MSRQTWAARLRDLAPYSWVRTRNAVPVDALELNLVLDRDNGREVTVLIPRRDALALAQFITDIDKEQR